MTLYGATARRWRLGLLVLPLLAPVPWAKAQTANPASTSSSPAPSSEPGPADNNRLPIVEEEAEKTPPRSAADSTLNRNSRRAGLLEPGEEARFSYWAQAQEAAGLLLFFSTPHPDVTPEVSKKSEPSFNTNDCRFQRLEFLQTGQHQFKFRNSGSKPLGFSFVLLSLSTVDLQKLEHRHEHQGEIATTGDVDVYAIDDARDSVRLWLRLKFASSSAQEVALIVSPEQGVKYFNWGRTQHTDLIPEESGPLLVALSAAQGGATYRLQYIQEPLEVLRLHAGEDSAVAEYDLPPQDERSIHFRIEGHERWDLQIETTGETFQLQGQFAGKPFVGDSQRKGLSKSAAEVILSNPDPHPGKVRIKVSAPPAGWDSPYWTLVLGCAAGAFLFWMTRFPWSAPFDHLRFAHNHGLNCTKTAIAVAISLSALLFFRDPLLSEWLGIPLKYLLSSITSFFAGFLTTVGVNYLLVMGRKKPQG